MNKPNDSRTLRNTIERFIRFKTNRLETPPDVNFALKRLKNKFEKGDHSISLNTSNLANGVYYISLTVNGVKETKKLVINN